MKEFRDVYRRFNAIIKRCNKKFKIPMYRRGNRRIIFYSVHEIDQKFPSFPLTCIFHVTRPCRRSPPWYSIRLLLRVSSSAALRERQQTHSTIHFRACLFVENQRPRGRMTTISEGCTRRQSAEQPKSHGGGRRVKKKRKKRVWKKFKNIWGKCRRNSMRLYVPVSG